MVESKTLQARVGTSRGSGCLCQLSDVHQQRLVGILTNLFSLTRLLQLDWPSFTLEGCSLLQGLPRIARVPSNTHTWPGYLLRDHAFLLFLHHGTGRFGTDSPLGMGHQNGRLRLHPSCGLKKNGPSFADAPSSICSLFSLQSSKQLPRSGLREFLDYELPQGIFPPLLQPSVSPGRSEFLTCCSSHSSAVPGSDAMAKLV